MLEHLRRLLLSPKMMVNDMKHYQDFVVNDLGSIINI